MRRRAGLAAKHWKQEADGKWDGGYQHTGYFLDYLEQRFGDGTVRKINGCLNVEKYDGKMVFGDCCHGHDVEELWEDYRKELKKSQEQSGPAANDGEPPNPVPTHAVRND